MAAQKKPAPAVRDLVREAAVQALRRLTALILDEETSPETALKAAALILEKVYPQQSDAAAPGGDFDILVKEE